MNILDKRWYLFRVRRNMERAAARHIERCGYTPAVPEVTRWVRESRHAKKLVKRTYPGLTSYVLVGFDGPPCFRKVLEMPFVTGVVGFGSFAARLPSEQVLAFLEHGAWDKRSVAALVQDWQPDYVEGDTVRLKGAGFDGVMGRLVSVNLSTRRARVAVPFLGTEREIDLDARKAYRVEAA